jgi:hypothetical protein
MGVNLRRLLWVRCSGREMKGLEQAFKCADLVLQATGGFGLIVVDLAGLSERLVRKVPLSTWRRFSRIVEKQETALVFSTPCAVTSTCSDLLLTLAGNEVNWSQTGDAAPTHAHVFAGFNFAADLARKRSFKKPVAMGNLHTIRVSLVSLTHAVRVYLRTPFCCPGQRCARSQGRNANTVALQQFSMGPSP